MPDLLTLTAPIEITAAAGDSQHLPRVEIMAYSGSVMTVPGWGPVVVDLAGLATGTQCPLLSDHNAQLPGIVGHGQPSIEKGQLFVRGNLAPITDTAKQIIELAKTGFPFQASVGVHPEETTFVRPGEVLTVNGQRITAGGFTLVKRGRLREVSILAAGADATTSVAIAAQFGKGSNMDFNQWLQAKGFDPNTVTPTQRASLEAAWRAETQGDGRQHLAAAYRLVDEAGDTIESHRAAEIRAGIAGGWDESQTEREVLRAQRDHLRAERTRGERPQTPAAHTRAGNSASGPEVLEAALLCHLGAEHVSAKTLGDQATQRGRDMRATSLVEILQASFQMTGKEAPRGREQMIRAAFSTAAIANIVSGAQNKLLLDQWQRLPLLCLQLTRQVPAKDFKESRAVRLIGRNSMFDQVGPGGEIAHGHLTDSATTFKIDTFARMFGITRQDIINDDLSAFDSMPTIIARGAGLKMESVFWSMVLANAASFFSEANGNLTDAPLDLEGLTAAVTLMRKMVDPDGEPILCEPKTLVVPPELEATADALYASTNVVVAGTADAVTTTPSGNSVAGKYRPVATPYISNSNYTGNSTTKWFLFADKASGVAAFISAFLNGQTTSTIEQSDADFNTLGIQYRGYADFGFAQSDPQGAVMSTGDGE